MAVDVDDDCGEFMSLFMSRCLFSCCAWRNDSESVVLNSGMEYERFVNFCGFDHRAKKSARKNIDFDLVRFALSFTSSSVVPIYTKLH